MEKLFITKHALERIFERFISPAECVKVLENGKIIEDYPDDKPFPSRLMLGEVNGRFIHIVVSQNNENFYLITAYEPDPELWDETFLKRK